MVRRRIALVGLLCGGVGACTSVRPIHPTTYLEDNAPPVVWVTYTNNTVVTLAEPDIRRDTLRGTVDGAKVKIPLSEVRRVEAKVEDGTKTAILLTTLGVAVVSTMYFAFISTAGPNGKDATCGVDPNGDPIQDC